MEGYRNWQRASGVVREVCRIAPEVDVLPGVPAFFALILMLMLDFGLPDSALRRYRRILARLPLDSRGLVIVPGDAAMGRGASAHAVATPSLRSFALSCTALPPRDARAGARAPHPANAPRASRAPSQKPAPPASLRPHRASAAVAAHPRRRKACHIRPQTHA
jgi:hypothetical protein